MLPFITICGKTLPTYALFGILGTLLGLLAGAVRCRRWGLSRDDCVYIYVLGVVGALIGAKVLYLLTVLPSLAADFPLLWQDTSLFFDRYLSGGMVFYGGFIGGLVGAWGAARYFRKKFSDFFPALAPTLPLVHGIGRLGCFSVGCCYGVPADPPLGIAFSQALAAPNGIPLFPVQLWECAAELIIFGFLLWYAPRCRSRSGLLAVYVLCYAPVRFVLEFFRGDTARGLYGPFSTSQWISLAALAAVFLWQLYTGRRRADARL